MAYNKWNPRNNSVQPLQDILKEIMGRSSMSKGIYPSRIPKAWNEVMGPSVARVTKNIYFRGGVVYVTLHSSVIRNELMMHRDQIIRNMNNNIGSTIVHELVLR
jgi:predicted nucleic acid-binding Zn ribbon protein